VLVYNKAYRFFIIPFRSFSNSGKKVAKEEHNWSKRSLIKGTYTQLPKKGGQLRYIRSTYYF